MYLLKALKRISLLILSLGLLFLLGCSENKNESLSSFKNFISQLNKIEIQDRSTEVANFLNEFPNSPVYETDSIVSIYFYGKTEEVQIVGDLQKAWSQKEKLKKISCGDSVFFHVTYTLPSNARLDYQFVIDENWMPDPRNPIITPSGFGPHSEIRMPEFISNPILEQREDVLNGSIDSIYFVSEDTSIHPRMVKIYIPNKYYSKPDLPVHFVLDGNEAMEFMFYTTVLDNLIADHKIEPILVAFIPPINRENEFLWNIQAFSVALSDELLPLLEKSYSLTGKAEERGVSGISNGGHAALFMALYRPDKFLNAAGQSSTIMDGLIEKLNVIDDESRNKLKIYTDVGQYDLLGGIMDNSGFLKMNHWFSSQLDDAQINHQFQVLNDGHEWANWRERTDQILQYFFESKNE